MDNSDSKLIFIETELFLFPARSNNNPDSERKNLEL